MCSDSTIVSYKHYERACHAHFLSHDVLKFLFLVLFTKSNNKNQTLIWDSWLHKKFCKLNPDSRRLYNEKNRVLLQSLTFKVRTNARISKRDAPQSFIYVKPWRNHASLCCTMMVASLPAAVCLLYPVLTCRLEAGQPVSSTLPCSIAVIQTDGRSSSPWQQDSILAGLLSKWHLNPFLNR